MQQANQQNPYDLYRLCQAYQGKGDATQAKEFCKKAANFNSLPAVIHFYSEEGCEGVKREGRVGSPTVREGNVDTRNDRELRVALPDGRASDTMCKV